METNGKYNYITLTEEGKYKLSNVAGEIFDIFPSKAEAIKGGRALPVEFCKNMVIQGGI